MATIAELMIKLGMDDGGLDKGMSSSQSKLKSWGESLRSVGTKLTAGVTMPLVGAGLAAIKWASDLDESLSKTNVLFGDAADDVVKFSEGSAKALGFSQQATLDYASAYAGMLNTVAETDTELGDMSTTLTQLTSDFASFHNLNPGDAFTVIQSALAGETEAIRRYGVDVSAAAVETEALAMGLAATASELTEQDKLLARYNILMKQTAEEQGDFARTAKSTSNQLKILRARIQDVGARFGKFLLPYVNMAVDRLLDLIDRLEALDPKWQKIILAVAAFAAALGPVLIIIGMMLPALGALATVFGLLLSPIGLVVIAIAALIGLGIYAWVNDLWGVRDAVYSVIDALSVFGPAIGDVIDILQALREGDFAEVWDEIKEAAVSFGEGIWALAQDIFPALGEGIVDLLDRIPGIGGALSAMADFIFFTAIPALIDFAGTVKNWITDTAIPALQGLWSAVSPYLADLGNWFVGTAIPAVIDFAQKIQTWIQNVAIPALQDIWSAVEPYLTQFADWFSGTAIPGIIAFAQSVTTWIRNVAIPAIQDVWTLVEPYLTKLSNWFVFAVGYFISFASDAKTYLGQAKDEFVALWNNIEATWSDFTNSSVYKFLDGIVDKVQTALEWLGKIPGVDAGNGEGQLDPWNDPRRYEPTRSGNQASEFGGAVYNNGTMIHTLPAVGSGPQTLFDKVKEIALGITEAVTQLANSVRASLQQVSQSFQTTATQVGSTMQQMQQRVQQAFTQITQIATQQTQQLQQRVMQAFQTTATQVGSTMQQMQQRVQQAFTQMVSQASSAMTQMRSAVQNAMTQMVSQASSAMSQFVSRVQSGMQQAVSATQSGVNQIRSVVASLNLSSQGFSIGASLGQGIAAGIQSYIGVVASAAAALVSAAINAAQSAAQARSPSRVMMALGGDMAEGLALGLQRGAADVAAATGSLIDIPSAAAGSATGGGNTYVSISLKSQELIDLIRNAETGGEFANNFGSQMGLYAGMP